MSIKRMICKHDYVFDTKLRLAVSPSVIKGVCKKCGKQIVITQEAYEASYKDKDNDK